MCKNWNPGKPRVRPRMAAARTCKIFRIVLGTNDLAASFRPVFLRRGSLFVIGEHLAEYRERGGRVYRVDFIKRLHKSFVIAPCLPL